MSNWEERRLLVKVAQMYYEEDMTQNEISKELGIYRTTIGRMLKKARKEGIVQIHIDNTSYETFELETKIKKVFQLKDVIIVPNNNHDSDEKRKAALGYATLELMNRIIKDDDTVGFAWGKTLGSMIEQPMEYKPKKVDFVPLVGGPGTLDSKYHVNTIIYNVANTFGGSSHFIDAAAVVEKKETKNDIVTSNFFKKILDMWQKLNIAVVGIGAPLASSNMIWTGFYGDKEIDELNNLDAVGDICSRFYDINGQVIESEVAERTVAIELDRLKELEYSIGVAESANKVPSILGALRGKYVNVLITNESTAEELLKKI
ncbi:sugar-binding transcriptional regulator [Alkalihalophilus lindianensis]|uniref:Sugar-binding transcriptional regulator n=1 Tax=Alkalihalophilus lindianensis TaxID=1630542 RepID=A0ABU3XBC4_9BACI|nr:sugar-binding transcriptional regulator [Alkalihalophilus lindianensis]MDV2685185.1 sugar-binding transcriptional regulator [Alkalihalophilus lindianensis]